MASSEAVARLHEWPAQCQEARPGDQKAHITHGPAHLPQRPHGPRPPTSGAIRLRPWATTRRWRPTTTRDRTLNMVESAARASLQTHTLASVSQASLSSRVLNSFVATGDNLQGCSSGAPTPTDMKWTMVGRLWRSWASRLATGMAARVSSNDVNTRYTRPVAKSLCGPATQPLTGAFC